MKARIQLVEPDKMLATVTMTAPVGEWRALADLLDKTKWPAYDFARVLGRVIREAEAAFTATTDVAP